MQTCNRCGEERPLTKFGKTPAGNYRQICNTCRNNYHRERYQAIQHGSWCPTRIQASLPLSSTPTATVFPMARDLHWAAGFLEGEGTFRCGNSPTVSAPQKDPACIYRLQGLFGGGVTQREIHDRSIHEWVVYGPRAHGVMLTLYPMLSMKRKQEVHRALGIGFDPIPAPEIVPDETRVPVRRCRDCLKAEPEISLITGVNWCKNCRNTYMRQRAHPDPLQETKLRLSSERKGTRTAVTSPATNDLTWAAGFLEAEGHFRPGTKSSQQVAAPQVNREPLERLQALFGGTISSPAQNGVYCWSVYGPRARGVMLTLFPLLSARRQAQIAEALG